MAVFETIRVKAGHLEFLEEHLMRLQVAAARCGFGVPEGALQKVEAIFSQVVQEGVARLYVTAGDGAPSDEVTQCRVAGVLEERRRLLPDGYAVTLVKAPHVPPFGGLKTANYWMNAESLRQAKVEGAQEGLLFNPDGFLVGACMANVFLRTPEGWATPCLESGARDGVGRAWVLARFRAKERLLRRNEVAAAQEMFLSSSWLGVMPAHQCAGRPLTVTAEVLQLREAWGG